MKLEKLKKIKDLSLTAGVMWILLLDYKDQFDDEHGVDPMQLSLLLGITLDDTKQALRELHSKGYIHAELSANNLYQIKEIKDEEDKKRFSFRKIR